MGVLQRFERRVSDVVNGAFARAFRAEVQPVEIVSALRRELDDRGAIVARDRTMVPNVFAVELSPADHERLAVYCDPLCEELAEEVRRHGTEQGYAFVGRVKVDLERGNDLDTGVFRIRSTASAASDPDLRVIPAERAPYLMVNGLRHPLTASVTLLGRGADVDVRIDDTAVSRHHAQIRVDPRGQEPARVVDLGSTNGVLYDGRKVAHADLRDGDTVMLGGTSVVYRDRAR